MNKIETIGLRFVGLLLLFFCIIPVAHGATLLIGDKISVEADEVIEDDYYVSVGSLGTTVMSGTIKGDMYAVAGSVTANGEIDGDFGSIGGLSYVHASVTDDVRIVAGEVVIDDVVGDDVFVIAGSLKILSTAEIKGDVIFYGLEAEINGPIGGSVYGSAGKMRIDTSVAGDIDVQVSDTLVLGGKAHIEGDVRHQSVADIVRAQSAIVSGEVYQKSSTATAANTDWRTLLVPLFVSLFATLTLYLLFKKEMIAIVERTMNSPLPAGAFGLLTITIGPFVAFLLISTVLGMLLGLFGLGVILVLVTAGFAITNAFVGALLSRLLVGKQQVTLPWMIVGAITFHTILLVPVIGSVVVVALVAITVGGMVLSLYRALA